MLTTVAPVRPLEVRERRVQAVDDALDVDVDLAGVGLDAQLLERAAQQDAGVVEQHVQPSGLRSELVDAGLELLGVAHVEGAGHDPAGSRSASSTRLFSPVSSMSKAPDGPAGGERIGERRRGRCRRRLPRWRWSWWSPGRSWHARCQSRRELAHSAGGGGRHAARMTAMTASRRQGGSRRYEHDGLRFDVRDEGPLDGDVVVLLHGFPERSTSWRDVVPALHAQGFRTVAPDQRGYSPGARPRRRRDYRSAVLTADVAALIERVGGPGPPRRPRLGRRDRLVGGHLAARPGPHPDGVLGAAPDGLPAGDGDDTSGASTPGTCTSSSCPACPSAPCRGAADAARSGSPTAG